MNPHDILGILAILCFLGTFVRGEALAVGLIFLTLALLFVP